MTRLAKAAAVAGIPNLDDQLLTAHYVVDAVGRQLAMRMINVTYPEGKTRGIDMGSTGDFRGTGVGTEALAALTRLGYDDHWGKPITVHSVLEEVYEHVCHDCRCPGCRGRSPRPSLAPPWAVHLRPRPGVSRPR